MSKEKTRKDATFLKRKFHFHLISNDIIVLVMMTLMTVLRFCCSRKEKFFLIHNFLQYFAIKKCSTKHLSPLLLREACITFSAVLPFPRIINIPGFF